MPVSETTHVLAKHGKLVRPKRSLWDKVRAAIINSAANKIVGGVHFDDLGNLAFWLALLFVACNLLAFAVILSITTTTVVNKKFLSLTKDTKGATCVEVPEQLSGMFQGDTNGYWQTSDKFNATRSLFQLTFTGRGITNQQYSDAMEYFRQNMTRWGNISVTRNSLWSLNTWASFHLVHPQTKLQLGSNVDAGIVYSGVVTSARLVNVNGSCGGEVKRRLGGYFDGPSKQIVMRQPTPTDASGRYLSVCPDQMSDESYNELLAVGASSRIGYFDYGFDVRMISLIVGLNTGTLTLDGLLRVDNANSRNLGMIGYIDTSFSPPMPTPVYCLDKSRALQMWSLNLSPQQISGPEICFIVTPLKTGRLRLFYPYVDKVRSESRRVQGGPKPLDMYVACKCPEDQMSPSCNNNNIIITLLYDQQWSKTRTVQMAASFQQIVVSNSARAAGDRSCNPLGDHFAGLIAYGRGGGPVNSKDSRLNTPLRSFTDDTGKFWNWSFANGRTYNQLLRDEFLNVCRGQCAMIYFFSWSASLNTSVNAPIDRFDLSLGQISPNASLVYNTGSTKVPLMLPVTMCIDTFSQPQALARLSQAPPVKLIQSYYECTNTLNAALMASIGNAAAAARLYVGLSWAGFGVLFVFFLRFRAKQKHEVVLTQHTKADLEAAQAQIRNELIWEELKELRAEFVKQKTSLESFLYSRLDSFKPLFYEQHGEPGPEEQEALERVGVEISNRLHQAKQADEKESAAYHGDERTQPRQRVSITMPPPSPHAFAVTKHPNFTGMHDNDQAIGDGRRGSRRLSAHPMGYVLSSTQPRSRASLVSSLVLRSGGSVAETQQL